MGNTHSYNNSDEQHIIENNTINSIKQILTEDLQTKDHNEISDNILKNQKENKVQDFYILIKNENIIGYTCELENAREKIKELINEDLMWAWNTDHSIKTQYDNNQEENEEKGNNDWLECKTYIKNYNFLFSRWQILSEYIIFKVDEIKVCLNKENVEIEKIEKK
jgi:hypothetical protein